MCGRFTLRTPMNVLLEQFLVETWNGIPARFNICPTQSVPIIRVRRVGEKRECAMLRWGLVPAWAKDTKIGNQLINARAETVAEKPSFRTAFKKRRCLVPVDGFYEWQRTEQGKQPYYIYRPDRKPFAFAGLWESWHDRATSAPSPEIATFTIITTAANEFMRPLHDRMPVILPESEYEAWLNPAAMDPPFLLPLLQPCPDDFLVRHAVSTYVNSPTHDSESCVRPLNEPG